MEFLHGLINFFGNLHNKEDYREPMPQVMDHEVRHACKLSEYGKLLALSKIKKTASGPDGVGMERKLHHSISGSHCSHHHTTGLSAWRKASINLLSKVDAPTKYTVCNSSYRSLL